MTTYPERTSTRHGAGFSAPSALDLPQGAEDIDGGHAYASAYRAAYADVASGVVDAARTATADQDDFADPAGRVRASLSALGDVAGRAGDFGQPRAGSPVYRVAGAESAGASARVERRPMVRDPRDAARLRGAVDGALEGAREIVSGWRVATALRDRMAAFGDATVNDWVRSILVMTNLRVLRPWLDGDGPGSTAIVGLSFVHAATTAVEGVHTNTGLSSVGAAAVLGGLGDEV